MVEMAEKKEAMPSEKVRREVEEIRACDKTDQEKLKALLRIYRREQSGKNRQEANMKFIREHIFEVSGGSFDPIVASVFTQGACTEAAFYLQSDKAEAAFEKLEKVFADVPSRTRRQLFRLERVPFLKMDWEAIKKGYPKQYNRARKIVGTFLQLTVRPLTKELREGK
jgi:hypothetical protein